MTDQRLISDAKRRARQLSRQTGRSYQSHLEEISREAGRGGWSAFLLDPAPFPLTREEPAPDSPPRRWFHRRPRRTLSLEEWIPFFIAYGSRLTLIGLALMTVPLVLLNLAVSGIPILADHPMAWMGILMCVMLAGMILLYSPWAMKSAYLLMLTFCWLAGSIREHITGRQMLRLWSMTGIPTVLIGAFIYVFGDAMPTMLMPISAETVDTMVSDTSTARTVQIEGMSKPNRLSSYRRRGSTTDLDLVIVDERNASRFMRGTHITPRLGGRTIATSMPDHPVYRWSGSLDCKTGRFHPVTAETADTVSGPAMAKAPLGLRSSKGGAVSASDLAMLCASKPGTTQSR